MPEEAARHNMLCIAATKPIVKFLKRRKILIAPGATITKIKFDFRS